MNEFRDTFATDFRAAMDERATTRGRSDCPASDRLARLTDGRLWPWQRRRLTEHVSDCAHCAEEMRLVLAAREGLLEALDMDSSARRPFWPAAGLTTAAAAMLAVVWLWAPLTPAPQIGPGAQGDVVFVSNFDRSNQANNDNDKDNDADRKQVNQDLLFSNDFDGNMSG